MKTMLKRLLPCLVLILALFVIVSCGEEDEEEYVYPNEVPLYTGTGNFLEINDFKVSNKDVYNRLIQSYGIETLENIIDEQLLANVTLTAEQEKEFDDQIKILKYGTKDVEDLTAEEQAEKLKEFEDNMVSNGFHTDDSKQNDKLYYKNYYRLEFKRYIKALEVLKSEEPEFEDEEYVSYFNSNFHKTYDLIIVTFDSEKEAKEIMKACDINTEKLIGKWNSIANNKEMSQDEIEAAFKNMYELAYNKKCEGATTYTYEDLCNFSSSSTKDSTIASRALKLAAGDYTHGPLLYGSRWFVIYAKNVGTEYINDADNTIKYADTEANILEKDANNTPTKLSDSLKQALYEDVLISSLVSDSKYYDNAINRVLYELRQDAGLEIFAENLEITYKTNYNTVFSSLDITDYDAFKETSNTSSTLVAKWNGGELSVDQMFDALTSRYGALLSLLFVQQYSVLSSKHNTVVDYTTGKVKDQDKYDDYVEEDITAYKESFEEGSFASYGYPASYGWENFLRDYIGLSSEAAIIVDFNSTLYNDVVALYTKALYTADVEDVKLSVLTSEDNKKTWGLSSDKWAKTYDTFVEVIDESVEPTISVAWKETDVEGYVFKNEKGDEIPTTTNLYYGHFVLKYKNAAGVDTLEVTDITVDQAVLEEYDNIYNETFSAVTSGLYVYYDKDLDGVADEVEEKDATLAKDLINVLWSAAKQEDSEKTIAENLTTVVREFSTSNHTSEWAKYKQAGLRIKVISGTTYSNSSKADEKVLELVKSMWVDITTYKDKFGSAESIIGQTLDPIYRYVKNNVVLTVNAYQFADKYNAVYAENGYYQLAVTKANNRTKYISQTKEEKPTLYIYEQYQLESSDRDLKSINCTEQIKSYYAPAIANLSTTDIVNKAIMQDCKDLLSKVTFANNDAANKDILNKLIEIALDEE